MTPSIEAPKGVKGISAVTNVVQDDELCFLLAEENRLSRSGKTMVRYQLLKVVRDDRLVTAYVYLGPAKKFPADQFYMVGGVIDEDGRGRAFHTVAELQDGAEELRGRKPMREIEPSDLQTQFRNQVEETRLILRHQSTFGPKVQIVRA